MDRFRSGTIPDTPGQLLLYVGMSDDPSLDATLTSRHP